MYVRTVLVLLTVCYGVFCNESEKLKNHDDDYEDVEENRREKQLFDPYDNTGWRVIDSDKRQNSDDWMPKQSPHSISTEASETVIPRRRRLRKKKKRPPPTVSSEEAEESHQIYHSKKVKPQTLEEINESWPDIEEEAPDYPRINYNRRRISPTYASDLSTELEKPSPISLQTEEVLTEEKPKRVYEKVRNPFAALEEAEVKAKRKKQEQENTTISPLKALLKQSGGSLNLSEILQQKNLSLNDLIQGNLHAISALTEMPETSTTHLSLMTSEDKFIPTIETKHISKNISESYDKFTEKNYIASQVTTHKRSYVITQPTTERRIFVPSHPKYYSTYKYKYNILKTDESSSITETTTEKTKVTTPLSTRKNGLGNKYIDFRAKYVSLKPKIKSARPVTSATSNDTNGKKTVTTITMATIPPKAMKIDIKELLGIPKVDAKNDSTIVKEEGPLKMTIDLKNFMTKPVILDHIETTTNREKVKSTSARDEIMQVLTDNVSRQNLARILQIRNMTIEELVAQRERGSSQLHLADIFHNQTKEPEPPSEPFIGRISEIPETFFNRKAKALQNNHSVGKHLTSSDLKDVKQSTTTIKTTVQTIASFPTYKIELDKIIKNNKEIPFQVSIIKSLYPNLYSTEATTQKSELLTEKSKNDKENIQRIEEIENTISEIVKEQFNIETNTNIANRYDNVGNYLKLPTGTKTAIIASAGIVGVSILVFLTILIIFKWSQKQKKRLCYPNSFFCSKIKTPILEDEPKRTIKTIMCETLGRNRRYLNFYPQSMSDYLWENDGKPFQ